LRYHVPASITDGDSGDSGPISLALRVTSLGKDGRNLALYIESVSLYLSTSTTFLVWFGLSCHAARLGQVQREHLFFLTHAKVLFFFGLLCVIQSDFALFCGASSITS